MSVVSGEGSSWSAHPLKFSSLFGHVRAVALALWLCLRIYGAALAVSIVAGLLALFILRQSTDYLMGEKASTGLQYLDTVLLKPPFWVSAAACLAPLVVLAGVSWLVINRRSFHNIANRAVTFGPRHGGMHTRLDEPLLRQRLSAFATFMRTFLVCMPLLAVFLSVLICAAASWGAAGSLDPAYVFAQSSLNALPHPPLFMDHFVYWMSALINFALIEAPQTFNWSISPLTLQDGAFHLLALHWLMGLTLVWMVAEYFSLAFNWSKHPQAASLKALMVNTDAFVREQWRQADTGLDAAEETEETPADETLPPDDELLAIVPTHVRLLLNARMALNGLMIAACGFVLGLAIVALIAAALLLIARLAIPELDAMSYMTAAGLSVVPAYLCIEIMFKLVDRGRMERRLASLYGSVMLAMRSGSGPADSFDDKLMRALRFDMLLTWLRTTLASFLGLALVFQCLYAAWITSSVMTTWPDVQLFTTSDQPTFDAIATFWLDIPLDVFLLGAPDLFGFGLSPLSYNPEDMWFVGIVFVFKAILVAEAINLIFAVWNTVADVHSQDTQDAYETLRKSAESELEAAM